MSATSSTFTLVSVDGLSLGLTAKAENLSSHPRSTSRSFAMIDFDMDGPVRPCTTTIRKAEISKEMK